MARKVIIDCDPGIGDAVALCLGLFHPELEVVAVTAVEGVVSAQVASRNVQAVVEQLDPPRLPRMGTATPPNHVPPISPKAFYGDDGLGGINLPVSQLHHRHASDKLICDEVRAAPNEVTILTFGPLTNVARAFVRDPEVENLVGQLVIVGGTVTAAGDVAPLAEANIAYDPHAARAVFRSATTKTIVPLDITREVFFSLGQMNDLPQNESYASQLLAKLLPLAFRGHHQTLGLEGMYLHSAVGLMLAVSQDLFKMQEMCGDVEVTGDLTMGTTVFDRRQHSRQGTTMEVAVQVDPAPVAEAILRGLERAGQGGSGLGGYGGSRSGLN